MKIKASELKKGNKIKMLDTIWIVNEIEISDIGKQGAKKCRLELISNQNKMVIIRPADYPVDIV